MARSPILFTFTFAVASLGATAQVPRVVVPQPRPQANTGQPSPQQQTVPQTNPANPQQQTQPPGNQQISPIKPSPNVPVQAAATANIPPATPVTPPVVTYRDGLLSVQATNSTLSSVLNAIKNKSGIEFEGLDGISDHVALSVGPAPAGEVLASILAGKFDFVAIGRPDDPSIVQRVILTPKGKPGATAAGVQQPQPQPNTNGEGGDPDETPDEQVNAEPQDTAVQPAPVPQQPQADNQQPQQQQPKSPEQLLQELQEMRKQQQMQQEGAPPPNPPQVPRKAPPQ